MVLGKIWVSSYKNYFKQRPYISYKNLIQTAQSSMIALIYNPRDSVAKTERLWVQDQSELYSKILFSKKHKTNNKNPPLN